MITSLPWRRLDVPGHEISRIDAHHGGWALSGTAVYAYEGEPCKLDYRVLCTSDWRTASAHVEGQARGRQVELDIAVDEERRWQLNGEDCPAVTGCLDLDLGFSPSTNLLPIRRLTLVVGESAGVRAAWLPFPALALEPWRRYTGAKGLERTATSPGTERSFGCWK